jgi:hypothetical protein
MKSHNVLFHAAVLLSLVSASATAQRTRERSLELSVGAGGVVGAASQTYRSRLGGAVDVMFSVPVGSHTRLGASWSGQVGLQNTDDCILSGPNSVPGRCLVALPPVTSWTALVSREWLLDRRFSMRMSAGPSFVSVYQREASSSYWSSMGGVSGRLDFMVTGTANVVASFRTALVPALPSNASGTFAFGLGIGMH